MYKDNGYAVVRAYAREMRKSQTEAEAEIWKLLRNRNLEGFKFLRQHILRYKLAESKSLFFIVDFYCHEKKLVVEIDGEYHRYQLDADKRRDEIMKAHGLEVIRFYNDEVMNKLNEVKRRIIESLEGLDSS